MRALPKKQADEWESRSKAYKVTWLGGRIQIAGGRVDLELVLVIPSSLSLRIGGLVLVISIALLSR